MLLNIIRLKININNYATVEKKNLDKKDFYSLWSNLTNAIMDRQETLYRLAETIDV